MGGKEKEKIKAEFARKVKQVETRRAIASSAAINQSRLDRIRAQSDAFASVSETAKKQLGSQVGSQTFLEQLIVQGLLIILEEDVVVRCREEDVTAVRACLNTAAELYSKTIETQTGARRTCRLTLDTKHLSANLVGGVTLSCQGGTIVDNTVNSRLNLIMEQDVPAVRSLLFPIRG